MCRRSVGEGTAGLLLLLLFLLLSVSDLDGRTGIGVAAAVVIM